MSHLSPEAKKKGKSEILLILGIIIAAGFLYFYQNVIAYENGATVEIVIDGIVTDTYDLNSKQSVDIETADGGINTLVIDYGSCHLVDANCPDKLCVEQGTITASGQSIICLPHKLVIRITGGEQPEVDTVAQ